MVQVTVASEILGVVRSDLVVACQPANPLMLATPLYVRVYQQAEEDAGPREWDTANHVFGLLLDHMVTYLHWGQE